MISNETVSLRCEHGSSGVDRKGLIVSALAAGFDVSSLRSQELNEPLLGRVVHHSGSRWSSFTVLEQLVDENSRVQFAGGVVVGVTWAVSSIRINAKWGENGVEMIGFGCVGVGFGGGGALECPRSGIVGGSGGVLVGLAVGVGTSKVDVESQSRVRVVEDDIHFFGAVRGGASNVPVADGEVAFSCEIKKCVLNVLVGSRAASLTVGATSKVLVGEVVGNSVVVTVAAGAWGSEASGEAAKANAKLLSSGDKPFCFAHEGRDEVAPSDVTSRRSKVP